MRCERPCLPLKCTQKLEPCLQVIVSLVQDKTVSLQIMSLPLAFLFPKLEKIASKYCYEECEVIDLRKLKTREKQKSRSNNCPMNLKEKLASRTIKKSKNRNKVPMQNVF